MIGGKDATRGARRGWPAALKKLFVCKARADASGIVTALRSVDPRITMRRFSTCGKDSNGGGNGDAWRSPRISADTPPRRLYPRATAPSTPADRQGMTTGHPSTPANVPAPMGDRCLLASANMIRYDEIDTNLEDTSALSGVTCLVSI